MIRGASLGTVITLEHLMLMSVMTFTYLLTRYGPSLVSSIEMLRYAHTHARVISRYSTNFERERERVKVILLSYYCYYCYYYYHYHHHHHYY